MFVHGSKALPHSKRDLCEQLSIEDKQNRKWTKELLRLNEQLNAVTPTGQRGLDQNEAMY